MDLDEGNAERFVFADFLISFLKDWIVVPPYFVKCLCPSQG